MPKANTAKHIRDSQPNLVGRAARTTLTVLAVMFIFEAGKIVFFPTLQTWVSHGMTLLLSSGAAGFAVFLMSARSRHAFDHAMASESRYQMLFECSPTGAYLISEDGHILDCNLSFCRLFGYSAREEMIGKSIDRLLPSGAEGSLFLALLRTGTPIENMEHRFQRKDGRDVWVLHSGVSFSRGGGSGGPAARGTMVDITERRQGEYKEHRLAALARCANYAVIALTPEGIIEDWNRGAERMFGYTAAEVVGRSIGIIASPERPNEYRKILEDVRRGADVEIETTRRGRDGQSFDVALSVSPIRGQSGDLIGVAAIIREISDRKRAERALLRSEAQYRLLFEKNPVPMWVFDRETLQFLSVNEAAIRSYGYREDEFLKMTIADIRPEECVPALLSSHGRNIRGLHRSGEWQHRTKDGRIMDVEIVSNTLDFDGHHAELVAAYNITERNRAEAQIQFLAYYDALTGLPNRRLHHERLEHAISGARRRNGNVAVLHIDLDQFKTINDTLGHSAGDDVLQQIAARIRESLREPDTVAKADGDSFLVTLNDVVDLAKAGVAARRIRDCIEAPLEVESEQVNLTASIGIAVHPAHGVSADELIKNAEIAMYGAKEDGRNAIRFFSLDVNGKALEQLAIERELRTALERNELFLVYQPQLDLATGKIVGLEALLRWNHPVMGNIAPDRFIPIAERNGQILAIGEWVLKTACVQTRRWQVEGLPVVPVAVNVSAIQFRSDGFASHVRDVLVEAALSPDLLVLELTESMLLSNVAAVQESVRNLQSAGIRIAIDDFGTGYSSLSYLKQLRVDKLKIDRSFIRDVPGDRDDAVITQAIISMATSLNLKVIAEGVETDEQMSFLREHGCNEIQGYWFSKPVLPEHMANRLEAEFAPSN